MTTQIAPDRALGHSTTLHSDMPVTATWQAGVDHPNVVNEHLAHVPYDTEPLEEILRYVKTYLLEPDGENLREWRKLFGPPFAFLAVTEITLGFVNLQDEPHLLRLWYEKTVIARIVSFDYEILRKTFLLLVEWVGEHGFPFTIRGYGPHGLSAFVGG